MRNIIIWHWFIKNLVGTWHRNDVDATSLRRINVVTTSCACWKFGPPPCPPPPQYSKPCTPPPNILNLPTPMTETEESTRHEWVKNVILTRSCVMSFPLASRRTLLSTTRTLTAEPASALTLKLTSVFGLTLSVWSNSMVTCSSTKNACQCYSRFDRSVFCNMSTWTITLNQPGPWEWVDVVSILIRICARRVYIVIMYVDTVLTLEKKRLKENFKFKLEKNLLPNQPAIAAMHGSHSQLGPFWSVPVIVLPKRWSIKCREKLSWPMKSREKTPAK